MTQILGAALASLIDPIGVVVGVLSGAFSPKRTAGLWLVPLLAFLSVSVTQHLAQQLHQAVTEQVWITMLLGRMVAFTGLFFVGFEGRRWWAGRS